MGTVQSHAKARHLPVFAPEHNGMKLRELLNEHVRTQKLEMIKVKEIITDIMKLTEPHCTTLITVM